MVNSMKKIIKFVIVFIFGIGIGYYINYTTLIKDIFLSNFKAFQVGVYTNLDAANTYSSKYNNSVIIKDNELYRVYVAILKDQNNIENMAKYLNNLGIDYYLRDINVSDKEIKNTMQNYEALMNNESEIVFLEINKMIMETYKESL